MRRWRKTCAFVVLAALTALGCRAAAQKVKVDPLYPVYKAEEGVSGMVKSVGSDTMNNLMALWGEAFTRFYPNVKIEIEGKGSSTAPPALISGAAVFGPMSRKMKSKEVDAFKKRFGYPPTAVRTAVDMLAVYVHKDNPIVKRGLSLPELDAIFSKMRKSGYHENITTWGQLGLVGEWADKPISIYGRNSASGTYGFFKKHVLFKGDYKDTVKEQPGSSSVVQAVASDRYAIGYSGIGYKTAGVAVVPLIPGPGAAPVPADPSWVSRYPLSRFLRIYLNAEPGRSLDPLRREFLKLVFSRQGQEAVIKDGYLPVSPLIALRDLARVGVHLPLVKVKIPSPAGVKKD